jgi:hypothetical protein
MHIFVKIVMDEKNGYSEIHVTHIPQAFTYTMNHTQNKSKTAWNCITSIYMKILICREWFQRKTVNKFDLITEQYAIPAKKKKKPAKARRCV